VWGVNFIENRAEIEGLNWLCKIDIIDTAKKSSDTHDIFVDK